MKKKNEFTDLVEKIDHQFKEIEQTKKRTTIRVQKLSASSDHDPVPSADQKLKEQKELQKFRVKEKITMPLVAFLVGHLALAPVYLKFEDYFPQMFLVASLSLCFICFAIIDFG